MKRGMMAAEYIRDECRAAAEYDEGREREGIVGECDLCGEMLRRGDGETYAVITADGRNVNLYCEYCFNEATHFNDILENAGLWFTSGDAEDVIDEANAEIWRRMQAKRRARGHWTERTEGTGFTARRFVCSVCGDWNTYGETRFCPDCGAEMEAEADHGRRAV